MAKNTLSKPEFHFGGVIVKDNGPQTLNRYKLIMFNTKTSMEVCPREQNVLVHKTKNIPIKYIQVGTNLCPIKQHI